MEYIQTKARLDEVGKPLGAMTEGAHASFQKQANAAGIPRPQLIITWVFKISSPMGYQAGAEVAYPISAGEWQDFLNDIPTYCVEPPLVYVVDGSKYTAPI